MTDVKILAESLPEQIKRCQVQCPECKAVYYD